LLQRLGALHEKLLFKLIEDGSPHVREQAVLLAEPKLSTSTKLRFLILGRVWKELDPRVRFQLAFSLGEIKSDAAIQKLAYIAFKGAEDKWTRYAVYSAVPGKAATLLSYLLDPKFELAGKQQVLIQELAALVGTRGDVDEVATLLATLEASAGKMLHAKGFQLQLLGLHGLADGMSKRGT